MPNNAFWEPFTQQVAWTLIHFVWQGLAIAAALPLTAWIGRVQRSQSRYALSLLALGAMALAPGVTFVLLSGTAAPSRDDIVAAPVTTGTSPSQVLEDLPVAITTPLAETSNERGPLPVESLPGMSVVDHAAAELPSRVDSGRHWQVARGWIVAAWSMGVALLSLRLIGGCVGVAVLRRRSMPAPDWIAMASQRLATRMTMARPHVGLSHQVTQAIALGLFRPMILLPAAWVSDIPADMLEGVLIHELAHLRRYDLWVILMQRLVETVLFYHPAVWWLSRRLKIERELCCDELVVSVTQDPLRYAETLELIGRQSLALKQACLVAPVADSQSILLQRIRHILGMGQRRESLWASMAGVLPLLLAVLVYWTASTNGPEATAQEDSKQAAKAVDEVDRKEIAATDEKSLAWKRTDKYVPPDFDYFPKDDAEAARRLDDFLSSELLRNNSRDEFLDVVRRGLRSTIRHKTIVLSVVGNTFIWNQKEQDPRAIELMYHATASSDADLVHYAMYFGPTVVSKRSDNLLRMMMENYNRFDREIQGRIHWGLRTYGDATATAGQLERLLDQSADIGEPATLAALDTYTTLTGRQPPRAERFANLGMWVVTFEPRELRAATRDGEARLKKILREDLATPDVAITDFAPRVDGDHWVGVVLLKGVAARDQLMLQIQRRANTTGATLPFNEKYLQLHRVGEFSRHLNQPVARSAPRYTPPPPDEVLSWNNDAKYVPPNFAEFFPDDAEAGKRLDAVCVQPDLHEFSDRELIELFRRGLKRASTSPNQLFGWLSGALQWPAAPYQTEIFFQAADPAAPNDVRAAAIYYGLTGRGKSHPNVVRLFYENLVVDREADDTETRGRMLWSVGFSAENKQDLADRLNQHLLDNHASMSMLRLSALDKDYEQLVEKAPTARAMYDKRGLFAVVFRLKNVDTVGQLEAEVRNRFAGNEYWVASAVQMSGKEPQCWGLVRGFAGRDWFFQTARQQDEIRVDFGGVFTPAPTWTRAADRIPAALKPFLKAEAAVPRQKPNDEKDKDANGQAAAEPMRKIRGRVVDSMGKPVAAADVFLCTRPPLNPHALPVRTLSTQTDADGNFQFQTAPETLQGADIWSIVPWNQKWAGPQLGWGVRSVRVEDLVRLDDAKPNPPALQVEPFVIRLSAQRGRITVLSPLEKGLPAAKVTVTSLYRYRNRLPIDLEQTEAGLRPGGNAPIEDGWIDVPLEFRSHLTGATGDDGIAIIEGVEPEKIAGMDVETENYGHQSIGVDGGYRGKPEGYVFPLNGVGRIEGEIVADARSLAAGFKSEGMQITVRTSTPIYARKREEFENRPSVVGYARATVDAAGKFVIPRIAKGTIEIETPIQGGSNFAVLPVLGERVATNQTRKLSVEVIKKVVVRGHVRLRGTEQPVAGTAVNLVQFAQSAFRNPISQTVSTDAFGEYRAQTLPGLIEIRLPSPPEGMATVHAWEQKHARAAIGLHDEIRNEDTAELPLMEVVPTKRIVGKLLDQDGQPISSQWDVLAFPSADTATPCGRVAVRDRGEFQLTYPDGFPPKVYAAQRTVKPGPREEIDLRRQEVKVVSEAPLVLQFIGKPRIVAARPPKSDPETILNYADLEKIREQRRSNNDRDAAAKLVGQWKMTLPAGYVYHMTLIQRNDGTLELDHEKKLVLRGTFTVRGKNIEMIGSRSDDVEDFVWQQQDDGSIKLIREQHEHGGHYTGTVLTRVASEK